MNSRFALISCLALLAGCGGPTASSDGIDTTSGDLAFTPEQTAALLNLVNDPAVDAADFTAAGASAATAKNLVAARAGADGLAPTADDTFFTTVASVDAVSGVGASTLTRLAAYGAAHPSPAPETVKGILFRGWQSSAVVWGVNQASEAEVKGLLDDRAAASLLSGRPFTSVAQMGARSYVAATALNKLLGHAQDWWSQQQGASNPTPPPTTLAGTFDGVTFDEADAQGALSLANSATLTQLSEHGVASSPAHALVAARPYTTVAQVAAVAGVGTATMKILHDWAHALTTGGGTTGGSCMDTFTSAVSPTLPSLLFMSESDRPLSIVTYRGAGTSAPTAASVQALTGLAGTAWTRAPADFYVALEPSSSTADATAANALQSAFNSQLTDVVYVAIQPPAGSPNQSEVSVFLVGRTACGDLVGVTAIAIET